ncbi:MAG: hypothetical protein ACJ79U_15240 [Myxococcales bacterium]
MRSDDAPRAPPARGPPLRRERLLDRRSSGRGHDERSYRVAPRAGRDAEWMTTRRTTTSSRGEGRAMERIAVVGAGMIARAWAMVFARAG